MKNIRDFDVKGKRILVRCDFNVPLDEDGNISDDFRIKKTLPTIEYLINNKAKIILLSHLGEPEGKIIPIFKMDNVKKRLQELLNMPVKKINDCIGDDAKKEALQLTGGEILLLENVRFYKEETDNDIEFAKKLASLGEIFINDAFGDCHRPHASIVSIPKFLPHGAGLLLEKEIENLKKIIENPKRPLMVLIGGKKAHDKVKFIDEMSNVADKVIISGLIKKELLNKKTSMTENIIGPEENLDAFDISKESADRFSKEILKAKTIVWNGPFGEFEVPEHKKGTLAIAKAIIKSKAFSVVGGGETIEFLHKEGILDKLSHVSTGGGAMLDYLSDRELPGIKALEQSTNN